MNGKKYLQSKMGSERWLHDQLANDVAFQQAELLELREALCLADRFISNIKGLVANEELDCAVGELDKLRVRNHLLTRPVKQENNTLPFDC